VLRRVVTSQVGYTCVKPILLYGYNRVGEREDDVLPWPRFFTDFLNGRPTDGRTEGRLMGAEQNYAAYLLHPRTAES